MIVLKIAAILLLYASFGVVHTILAGLKFKEKTALRYPAIMPYYRLLFNVFSMLHFYLIYEFAPAIDIKLYDLMPPFDLVMYGVQICSLFFLLYSLRYFDGKEFLGFSQIIRHWNKQYKLDTLDEESTLQTAGPYRISRHPVYFGSIVFLTARPFMFLDYFIQLLCITVYFYIGSVYEEKKLVKKFGTSYMEYQKSTPMIFPFFK